MSVEVLRIVNIKKGTYSTNCIGCGKEIKLHYRSGDPEEKFCCGYEYGLEHTKIDFVVKKNLDEI